MPTRVQEHAGAWTALCAAGVVSGWFSLASSSLGVGSRADGGLSVGTRPTAGTGAAALAALAVADLLVLVRPVRPCSFLCPCCRPMCRRSRLRNDKLSGGQPFQSTRCQACARCGLARAKAPTVRASTPSRPLVAWRCKRPCASKSAVSCSGTPPPPTPTAARPPHILSICVDTPPCNRLRRHVRHARWPAALVRVPCAGKPKRRTHEQKKTRIVVFPFRCALTKPSPHP